MKILFCAKLKLEYFSDKLKRKKCYQRNIMIFTKKTDYSLFILTIWTFSLFFNNATYAYDTLHFYRATPFFQKPRFERNWLSSLDINIRAGINGTAFDKEQHKVPLFDIYGTHNMKDLGAGVPRPNDEVNNPLDIILTDLEMLAGRDNFATFSIDGEIRVIEAYFHFIHNFYCGFFGEIHLPVRSI